MVSELYLIERYLLHAYVHSMPIRQHLWGTVTNDRTDCLAFRVLCADYRTTTAGRQAQTQSENRRILRHVSRPACGAGLDLPGRRSVKLGAPHNVDERGVLLIQLGVSRGERDRIESVLRRQPSSTVTLSEEQQTSRAVIRLAADPPLQVGRMQRRTSGWLVRPFPLGLRFSGKNMSPLPCWLTGAQNVWSELPFELTPSALPQVLTFRPSAHSLNFSDPDQAVQLHFALFNGSGGGRLEAVRYAVRASAGSRFDK
jgi:hypothetical protein